MPIPDNKITQTINRILQSSKLKSSAPNNTPKKAFSIKREVGKVFGARVYPFKDRSPELTFFSKKVEITPTLTKRALKKHANGVLRYNNITDLTFKGSWAVEKFIDRANSLFRQNLSKLGFKHEPNLKIYYTTVFSQGSKEPDSKAFPIFDFLSCEFDDENGEKKHGYGAMFSSYLREYDRAKIEKTRDLSDMAESIAFFNSICTKDSPSTGLFDDHPIIMIPQIAHDTGASATDTYFKNLGMNRTLFTPETSLVKTPYRYYHKGDLDDHDPQVLAAITSIGQAMFEYTRPEMYRWDSNKQELSEETKGYPVFNFDRLNKVKWEQHKQAVYWIKKHLKGVSNLTSSIKNNAN